MRQGSGVVFLAAALLTGCQKAAWEDFSSKDGFYSILLPSKPDESRQPAGGMGLVNVAWTATDGDMSYSSSHLAYPPAQKQDSERLRAAAIRGFLSAGKGTVLNQKEISLGSSAGTAVTFAFPEQSLTGEMRVFFIQNRLYSIMAIGPKQHYASADAAKCLDSFKLIDAPK
jgi:hypothetical protein